MCTSQRLIVLSPSLCTRPVTSANKPARHRSHSSRAAVERLAPQRRVFSSYYPQHLRVAVVGAGIAGACLGLGLQRSGVSVRVFERDACIQARKQGYALTLQQGLQAMRAVGIDKDELLALGTTSQGHLSYNQHGELLGRYGVDPTYDNARQNKKKVHLPRTALRELMLQRLAPDTVRWGKQLLGFHLVEDGEEQLELTFQDGSRERCGLLVGADGIFSTVRRVLEQGSYLAAAAANALRPTETSQENMSWTAEGGHTATRQNMSWTAEEGHTANPQQNPAGIDARVAATAQEMAQRGLSYLGLMVLLGITRETAAAALEPCFGRPPAERFQVQWLDGTTRCFTMPYDQQCRMWQLSFPMTEHNALAHTLGEEWRTEFATRGEALKHLALSTVANWPAPLTSLVERTPASTLSGHPLYDRHPNTLMSPQLLDAAGKRVLLLGDALHPLSPFKGQGANEALLDVHSLLSLLSPSSFAPPCNSVRKSLPDGASFKEALRSFARQTAERAIVKVGKSRQAARLLHSSSSLAKSDTTRAYAASQAELKSKPSFNRKKKFPRPGRLAAPRGPGVNFTIYQPSIFNLLPKSFSESQRKKKKILCKKVGMAGRSGAIVDLRLD
eukprot:g2471.t1